MESEIGLSHDDLLFVLFGLSHAISKEGGFTSHAEPGEFLQQGFLWTTQYYLSNEQFFSIAGSREPDGHITFEPGNLLVTVEATSDPKKTNLKAQLEFFCSDDYTEKIVDKDFHELWLFVAGPQIDEFLSHFKECLSSSSYQREIPFIVWRIDYDRSTHTYFIEKVLGEHSNAIKEGSGVPSSKVAISRPQSFPLLSSRLSYPAVVFAVGRELLGEILYPRPERTIRDYHRSFPANSVPLKYFATVIGYLEKLIPELIEVSGGTAYDKTIRVKRNQSKLTIIKERLDLIRGLRDESAIIQMISGFERAKEEAQAQVEEELEEDKRVRTLDEFME